MGIKLATDQVSNVTKDDEVTQILQDTSLACSVALDILNDLLLYDKLESGILVLSKQDVNVFQLVTECAKMFKVQMQEKNIESKILNYSSMNSLNNCAIFSPVYPNDTVNVDKSKISQVIRNFISNAVKFTPRGGDIHIKLKFKYNNDFDMISNALDKTNIPTNLTPSSYFQKMKVHAEFSENPETRNNTDSRKDLVAGYLIVEVTDNGAGISQVDQNRLFKEIIQFRPDLLQDGGGSGLGMWLSKSIVDLHGG